MYLPPLQPVVNSDIRICGDVEIHPTASIAPGVILQAAPNSRIVIGEDVCLGMGVIISAYGGVVTIASGATLGSGVLIVGHSQIGSNACVGTTATIFNASVDSMNAISPGSVVGDISRQETTDSVSEHNEENLTEPANLESDAVSANTPVSNDAEHELIGSPSISEASQTNSNNGSQTPEKARFNPTDEEKVDKKQVVVKNISVNDSDDPWVEKGLENGNSESVADLVVKEIEKSVKNNDDTTIGKLYIDQLLVTLFPHKKQVKES